jgi:hypothetical protein
MGFVAWPADTEPSGLHSRVGFAGSSASSNSGFAADKFDTVTEVNLRGRESQCKTSEGQEGGCELHVDP